MNKTRIQTIVGIVMLGFGGLLLIIAAAYYSYGVVANARSNELFFSAERPTLVNQGLKTTNKSTNKHTAANVALQNLLSLPTETINKNTIPTDTPEPESTRHKVSYPEQDAPLYSTSSSNASTNDTVTEIPYMVDQSVRVVEHEEVIATTNDGSPSDLVNVGSSAFDQTLIGNEGPEDFLALISSTSESRATSHETSSADDLLAIELEKRAFSTRILIPAIGIDSGVKELELLFFSGGTKWETPKHVVGHVPSTAGPGDQGQGWYLGHLQSPFRTEGNVFSDLPKIPYLLNRGELVDVFLEVEGRRYQYQVYHTEVIEAEDLKITHSGQQDITLVTCYPRLAYDKRLLVTAALVDVTDIGPS